MKCAYCGKRNKPGAVTCTRCGIALPPSPPPEGKPEGEKPERAGEASGANEIEKRLNASKHPAAGLIAVIAAVLALAVLIICLATSGSLILPGKNAYSVCDGTAFWGGEPVAPNGVKTVAASTSANGRRAAVLCADGTLYTCRSGEDTAVAKGVVRFTVSGDGKRVLFVDESSLLWSYDCSKKDAAPVCLCSDAVNPDIVVSPDGKSVLVSKRGDSALYLIKGRKIKKLGENYLPVSVSDGGKHVFAFSVSENALYYINRKAKATFIRSNIETELFINSRHDEIVFSTNAGTGRVITMFCRAGKDPVELINGEGSVAPVMPVSGVADSEMFAYYIVTSCPMTTFKGKLFAGFGMVRLGKKGAELIDPTPVNSPVATDDYGTVYYKIGSELFRRTIKSKKDGASLVEDCANFMISENGSVVWYRNHDGELRCRKGSKDTLIALGAGGFVIKPNGREALFEKDGFLFLNKGGRAKQTFTADGVKADAIFADEKGIYIHTEEGWKTLPDMTDKVDLSK
ncbi:MAG: hypothetical protein K6G56_03245 [Clostridiales bacterium]|nr:hypothetical protein [Clostridiales bacterium]